MRKDVYSHDAALCFRHYRHGKGHRKNKGNPKRAFYSDNRSLDAGGGSVFSGTAIKSEIC